MLNSLHCPEHRRFNLHAPVRKKRVKHWHQPEWINQNILAAIHLRDDLFKKGQSTEYKKQRNKVKRMIISAKRSYYKEFIESNNGNSKKLWQCIRNLSGTKRTALPSAVKNGEGEILDNEADIAAAFNLQFSKLSRRATIDKMNSETVKEKLETYVQGKLQNSQSFSIPAVTSNYVLKQLQKLDTNKAKGVDEMNPLFLKVAAHIIAPSLTHIFNLSLRTGTFPGAWKCAKVTPLHKKGAKDNLNNYRPISVLSVISKVIERHVHDSFYAYLSDNDLLYEGQSGFRPNHSCATALTHMTDKWLAALDSGNMVGVAFVDLSKAFDSVHHNILISKLKTYGCSPGALTWCQSYLNNRSQIVNVKGHLSDEESILCGVPQGSILGPLLFILFVNDIHLHLEQTDSDLYADDTNIYAIGKSVLEINSKLEGDMNVLWDWCSENALNINTDKTKCMLVSTSQRRSQAKELSVLQVNVNNIEIPICRSHRVLGVHLSDVFDWEEQMKAVCRTLNYYLFVFKKIKRYLPEKARIAYCNGCILSHLDFCNTIWGNGTKVNLEKVLRLQKRAARMIFDDYVSASADLFAKLKWLPIEKRVAHNKAVMVYKCLNYTCSMPVYMENVFQYESNARYSLRSEEQRKLIVPRPRIDMYKQSFSYSGAKIWNSLPASVRNSESIAIFKKRSFDVQSRPQT